MRLRLGEHEIDCTHHTAVMAILNISDDSPVAHSRVGVAGALDRARALAGEGAEIIDVGANSTLTGSRDLGVQEEIDRVAPVVEAIVGAGLPVSVDTWKAPVARAAAEAGAHILNDVSGFTDDAMVAVAAEFGLPGIVMHMRGKPKHHREVSQRYDDVGADVRAFLVARAVDLRARGVEAWLDPGFEFGKTLDDNVRLYEDLPNLVATGQPVLISASRKYFLAELIGGERSQQVEGLTEATMTFNALAGLAGVHVVRVHDVHACAIALRLVDSLRRMRAEHATGG
ncbi:MAG: dihydropteroate synthase [Dehalococcoidia bacterium]